MNHPEMCVSTLQVNGPAHQRGFFRLRLAPRRARPWENFALDFYLS
jgi:hypothetical protein